MQISSVTDIVEGELQNSPSISFVYHIKTNAKRVNEGDLFIAKNKKDLELAIEKGAFGIVYDFDIAISDSEIAWIKVDNYKQALIRLFRFKLSHLDLKAYYCDNITYDLLHIYKSLNKNIRFLNTALEDSIKILENINDNDILIATNKKVLDKIYPNNSILNSEHSIVENLTSHSLFETSFSYEGHYFFKLKISSLYVNQLLNVYEFYDREIDFSKLKKFNSFKPIFVDRFINIIDFGKSDKFLVSQKNLALVKEEIAYIKKHYKYARTIFITSEYMDDLEQEQVVINSLKELRVVLKNKKFNCAYIAGFDLSKIKKTLIKPEELPTLL